MRKNQEKEQLELQLKRSPFNFLNRLKNNLRLKFTEFATYRYFRDPFVWLFIVISVTGIILQLQTLIDNYSIFPDNVPFLQSYIPLKDRLISREYLFSIPSIGIISLILSVILSWRQFNINQHLSILTLFCHSLATCILTYEILLLYSYYIT